MSGYSLLRRAAATLVVCLLLAGCKHRDKKIRVEQTEEDSSVLASAIHMGDPKVAPQLLKGFYGIESIFLVLAFLALGRVRSLESLRYHAPGEWGKLLGLDRIPEVRTLRQKITALCSEQGQAQRWSNALAKQWMAEAKDFEEGAEGLPRFVCQRHLAQGDQTLHFRNRQDHSPAHNRRVSLAGHAPAQPTTCD